MDYFERIAGEWYERSGELAEWVMAHLVNRTDVWGRYTRRKSDEASRAVTVPFRDERGKVFLDTDSLRKHFRTRQPSGQLGIHSASADLTSRWLAIDIDLHEGDDSLSVSKEGKLAAACLWRQILADRGLPEPRKPSRPSGSGRKNSLQSSMMCSTMPPNCYA